MPSSSRNCYYPSVQSILYYRYIVFNVEYGRFYLSILTIFKLNRWYSEIFKHMRIFKRRMISLFQMYVTIFPRVMHFKVEIMDSFMLEYWCLHLNILLSIQLVAIFKILSKYIMKQGIILFILNILNICYKTNTFLNWNYI